MEASGTDDYVLGTRDEELVRLGTQHQTWVVQAYALFERGGLRVGDRVLDLGCGPGFTSFELAQFVGPTGSVLARDRSARFLGWLEREAERRGLTWITPSEGTAESLELEPGSLDLAYTRWLLCWLPDPLPAVRAVARALRPGGAFLVQDYLDWGAMTCLPRCPSFDRAVQACLESFAQVDADPRVAASLPVLAERSGLVVETLEPVIRTGAVGSLVWRWITDFLRGYVPGLVAAGILQPADLARFTEDLAALERDPNSRLLGPLMAEAVLRKPLG